MGLLKNFGKFLWRVFAEVLFKGDGDACMIKSAWEDLKFIERQFPRLLDKVKQVFKCQF